MKILIAEQSCVVRERLATLLDDMEGVEIVGQVEDPRDAGDLATDLKAEVVILDLPTSGGQVADVLASVKRIDPAPTVIVLTNDAFPQVREECIDRGADYFLDKSTELPELLSILQRLTRTG